MGERGDTAGAAAVPVGTGPQADVAAPAKPKPRARRAKVLQIGRSAIGSGGQMAVQRANAFSASRQTKFFDHLAANANISAAAAHAGVAVQTIWKWRRTVPAFAARYDQVLADGYADLEMRMLGLALHGTREESEAEEDAAGIKRQRKRRDAPAIGEKLLVAHEQRATQERERQRSARAARATTASFDARTALIDRLARAMAPVEAAAGAPDAGGPEAGGSEAGRPDVGRPDVGRLGGGGIETKAAATKPMGAASAAAIAWVRIVEAAADA